MRQNNAGHRSFKADVLRRDEYRCKIDYPGACIGMATQVDRIDNAGGYTFDNCQSACEPCHIKKTSREGHAARGHSV